MYDGSCGGGLGTSLSILVASRLMDNESFPFQNCSNFTNEQLAAIAYARGITAAACGVILLVVFVGLFILAKVNYQRVCGTVVKRLTIGFTAVSVLRQLILALHLLDYSIPGAGGLTFCQATAFFDQYTGSVSLLFILGISLVLFLKVAKTTCSLQLFDDCYKGCMLTCTCCSKEINKLEIALFASVFVLSLLFDWIPFNTHSYGPSGAWCWIRSFEIDCSAQKAGFWEQIWLWAVPLGTVILITLVLFVTSLGLIGCTIKDAGLKNVLKLGITDSLFSLAFLGFLFMLYPPQVLAYFYPFKQEHFVFWMFNAVSSPLRGAFIPLTLLVLVHLPLSSMVARACRCCKYQRHISHRSEHGEEQVTVHSSSSSIIHQPSHTTWHPSHDNLEKLSLVRDSQVQDYGNVYT